MTLRSASVLEKRPIMVADNIANRSAAVNESKKKICQYESYGCNLARTYDSFAGMGILAFPRNCRVISLKAVVSVRYRNTCPLNVVGSTSGPVPFRVRYGESRMISRRVLSLCCWPMAPGDTVAVEELVGEMEGGRLELTPSDICDCEREGGA